MITLNPKMFFNNHGFFFIATQPAPPGNEQNKVDDSEQTGNREELGNLVTEHSFYTFYTLFVYDQSDTT